MSDLPPLAYLTSAYARASDSFIRAEVEHIRAMGHAVRTFSIRKPAASEIVSEQVRREREATEYLLTRANAWRLASALVGAIVRSPGKLASATALTLRCSAPGLKGRIWALAYLVEACFLAERLRAQNIGHLHNHIGEGSAMVAMLAAILADIPYSLTIHGPGEFDYPRSLALHEKVARAAFVVAVSAFGRSQLLRWTRVEDWPKIKIVRCGVGEDFTRQPRRPCPDEPRFVCVGRLVAEKGIITLLEAVHALVEEGLHPQVVILGDGPLRRTIEMWIHRRGLAGHVTLIGWASTERVRAEMLNARAFVLPSFAENLPVAIMEAFALGRPVISTFIGGIPELVRHGVNGWLVPASCVGGLASAMREALLVSPADLSRMGEAGAEAVAERHDARTSAAECAALFRGRPCGPETSAYAR